MTYDPSLRVLTVLELLQAREEVTGAELARRLEVSPRTVQRYVARLQDLGIPVEGRRGVGGAYRLKPGFRLPPLMFTGEEALALTLGLRALHLLGLNRLTPAAEAAGAKLRRTLPEALRAEVEALEHAVQLDASPWVVRTDAALLADLLSAVRRRCAVELTYRSGQASVSERRVDPYRVLHLEGRWYLVGWCHLRTELRSFRLDRIGAHMLTQETFTPPADFDALAFVRRGLPTPTMYDIDVWIAAPPEALRGQLSLWHTDIRPDGAGTRVRCQRESLGFFAAFLLGLPYEFRVHGPPELPGEFRRLAERGLRLGAAAGCVSLTHDFRDPQHS